MGKKEQLTHIFDQLLAVVEPGVRRGGLVETPERAAKAWLEYTSGYENDAHSILKTFEDGGDYSGMVILKNAPFFSHCEHHLAPIIGTASIGYVPNGRIAGLSKLSRLVDMHARRLQVQERMTENILQDMVDVLDPLYVAVRLSARHMCMESRGICQTGHCTITLVENIKDGYHSVGAHETFMSEISK